MSRKEYRAKMRAKHGPDWWKKSTKKSAKKSAGSAYEEKWAGFPVLVGGMENSSLLEPQYGDSVYKGDLVYADEDAAGATSWAITVRKKGPKYTITGSVQEPYAGGLSREVLFSGSRGKAIRYLKGLKGYSGPHETDEAHEAIARARRNP